ncbi:MAG: hypothetical protein C4345_14730, partial [Chloroflexota bacterium]
EPLQIHRATVLDHGSHPPGRIAVAKREVWVACGHGALRLDIVQPAGGKPMPGPAWVTGRRFESGIILGQEGDPGLVPPLVVPVIVDGESRP